MFHITKYIFRLFLPHPYPFPNSPVRLFYLLTSVPLCSATITLPCSSLPSFLLPYGHTSFPLSLFPSFPLSLPFPIPHIPTGQRSPTSLTFCSHHPVAPRLPIPTGRKQLINTKAKSAPNLCFNERGLEHKSNSRKNCI